MIVVLGEHLRCATAAVDRWRLTWVVLLAGVIVGLAHATPALAISHKKATQIALAAVKPNRAPSSYGVVVLGLQRPLGPNDDVSEAKAGAYRLKALGRKTWLFWEDLEYGLNFTHASRLVLIDDRTGRVVRRQSMSWWPLVDGRRRTDLAGHNSFRFTGRVGGHKLKPGAYRLQAIPSLNGRAGIARVTSSKIVR